MAIDTGIGISLTSVETTRQAPLGQTVLQPAGTDGTGEKVWIYIKALDSLAAGNVVTRDLSAMPAVGLNYEVKLSVVSVPPEFIVGVAQHAIAASSFGWVLREGQGEVKADSAAIITGALGLISGTTAVGTAQAVGAPADNVFGYALETVAVSALATCVVDCKG
tara:strand:- start:825 stop:1316 length:492 start_codon:yes stop_codon:yes gene_type:complete